MNPQSGAQSGGRPTGASARHLALLAAIFVVAQSARAAGKAGARRPAITVVPRLQGTVSSGWSVVRATVDEGLTGTDLLLCVRNTSGEPKLGPTFYAEYVDAKGRVCFTAILRRRDECQPSAFLRPGESRTLLGLSFYLFPASIPVTARLWPVSGLAQHGEVGAGRGRPPVEAPATLNSRGFTVGRSAWRRVWLGADVAGEGAAPVADVLLALLDVSPRGSVSRLGVLWAADGGVKRWFLSLMRHHGFSPARRGSARVAGRALVLVRALVSLHCLPQDLTPPSSSPQVAAYLRGLAGTRVPPVTVILLLPARQTYWNGATPHPAYFADPGVGAGWATVMPCVQRSGPVARGPVLRTFIPPEASETCP